MRAIREYEMTDRMDLILKLSKAYDQIEKLKIENKQLKDYIDYQTE